MGVPLARGCPAARGRHPAYAAARACMGSATRVGRRRESRLCLCKCPKGVGRRGPSVYGLQLPPFWGLLLPRSLLLVSGRRAGEARYPFVHSKTGTRMAPLLLSPAHGAAGHPKWLLTTPVAHAAPQGSTCSRRDSVLVSIPRSVMQEPWFSRLPASLQAGHPTWWLPQRAGEHIYNFINIRGSMPNLIGILMAVDSSHSQNVMLCRRAQPGGKGCLCTWAAAPLRSAHVCKTAIGLAHGPPGLQA